MNQNQIQDVPARHVTARHRSIHWIIGLLLFAVLIWFTLSLRPTQYHAYVIFKPADDIELTFLIHGDPTQGQCTITLNRMVDALVSKCSTCKILQERCLDKLDSTQRKLLSEEPLKSPSARMPRGVVSYASPNLKISETICTESERQSVLSGQPGQLTCYLANTRRPFPNEQETSTGAGPAALGYFAHAIAFLSIAFAMLLAVKLLSARHPADAREAHLPAEPAIKISNVAKRFADLLIAISLVVFLFPVFLLVSALILILEGPPIFYVSRRFISLDHRVSILKFRTMVRDATSPKYRLKERFMKHGYLDIPLDCEVYTPIGRILERTQLVELLQLFNVIFHGMSLVGNRPLPLDNVEALKVLAGWKDRFTSPAGITGISQIAGKYDLSPTQRLELECLYAKVYTGETGNILQCDFLIILNTIRVVLLGKYIGYEKSKRLLLNAAGS